MNVAGGKGDKARPMMIAKDQFNANFEAIFGKKTIRKVADASSEADGGQNNDAAHTEEKRLKA